MKRILESLKHISPILIICLIYFGMFLTSRTGDLLLTQYYMLYIVIIFAGLAIIKYSHRDLAMLEARFIRLDLKVKSVMFIGLILVTLILTVSAFLHVSYLIIFYLLIGVFVVELTTLYQAYNRAKARESNGYKNPYL